MNMDDIIETVGLGMLVVSLPLIILFLPIFFLFFCVGYLVKLSKLDEYFSL